jgi:hypothetical protein
LEKQSLRPGAGRSKYYLESAAFGECCANNPFKFGIQNSAGTPIIACPWFAEHTHHGAVNFIIRSQMIQRSTNYPIKMAALVICQLSVLAMIVWIFH